MFALWCDDCVILKIVSLFDQNQVVPANPDINSEDWPYIALYYPLSTACLANIFLNQIVSEPRPL